VKRFVLTAAAEQDVDEIADFIAKDSLGAAKQVVADLRKAMRRLAAMPQTGHLREDLSRKPVRFWSVYSYLISYRPDTKPLQIIRVLHGSRDVRRILGDDE
jgi:plasmid stabilization system protein ParE